MIDDLVYLRHHNAAAECRCFDDGGRVLGVRTGVEVAIAVGLVGDDERDLGRQVYQHAGVEFEVGVDGADPERFRCDEFGELAALRSGKGEVQAIRNTALEHVQMFGQPDDRLHHVQIMDSCGIDLRQCRREKVRLLLIVAFNRHAVAGLDDRFQQLRHAFR